MLFGSSDDSFAPIAHLYVEGRIADPDDYVQIVIDFDVYAFLRMNKNSFYSNGVKCNKCQQ